MKHKTAELEGALLDAAVVVALAGGAAVARHTFRASNGDTFIIGKNIVYGPDGEHFHPSTDWQDGGPIIEREGIALLRIGGPGPIFWSAKMPAEAFDGEVYPHPSATPLIAAMRAFVASKLGEEVEL